MARELITTWSDYQAAVERLLAMAGREILIYDEDIGGLRLDVPPNFPHLQRVLKDGGGVHIALRNADRLRQRQPQLLTLLSLFSHRAAAQQTPEHINHLRDNMILVDGKHGLIRFDRDQPRSKLLIDEVDELRPYAMRFAEIWSAGGDPVSSTTLGL
jgi:hypothetical protein